MLCIGQAELLAVLTMMVEGIEQKELDKIAEKFVDEIDNSQVSLKILLRMILSMILFRMT